MILYFSATGNSEHVARRVAAATGDKVMSIERFDAESLRLALAGGPCQLGFVAPVYAWGLPTPMIEVFKDCRPVDCRWRKGRRATLYVLCLDVRFDDRPIGEVCPRFAARAWARAGRGDERQDARYLDACFRPVRSSKGREHQQAAEAQIDAVVEAVRAPAYGQHDAPSRAPCLHRAHITRLGCRACNGRASLPSMPIAASIAASAPSAAPWRQLRCVTGFPSGQSRSAPPVSVACTAVPSLPSHAVNARLPTVSTSIPSPA